VSHQLLGFDGFVLDIQRAELSTDGLHGIRDTRSLYLALRPLLPVDFDLGVLRSRSWVAASFRVTASATSDGYCTLPTTTLLMMKGLASAY
jgi:hypothetical protein